MIAHSSSSSLPHSEGSKPTCEDIFVESKNDSGDGMKLKRSLPQWILPVALVAPYAIGLAWHVILHPIASVLTGDFSEARRWYIDESSLDPSAFRMNKRYNLIRPTDASRGSQHGVGSSSLCHALWEAVTDMASCQQSESLEVAPIVPSNAAVAPTQEAVAVVVPHSADWFSNQFHYSVLQLFKRLSSPEASPWMGAKTVLLAAPRHNSTTLHDAVEALLDSESSASYMIRNVLVLNVDRSVSPSQGASSKAELRILPQGRRGVLPNMDLVFLVQRIYSQFQFAAPSPRLTVHRHSSRLAELRDRHLPAFRYFDPRWLGRLLDLLGFEYTLAASHQVLPHAPALEQGIDALTIELGWEGGGDGGGVSAAARRSSANALEAEVVSKLEPTLRALCNLHERLHHSTRLYLLVSPERFVKHEEYLVPNLLLLIPLVVRAVALICVELERPDLPAIGRALSCAAGAVLAVAYGMAALSWLRDQRSLPLPSGRAATAAADAVLLGLPYLPVLFDKLWRRRRGAPFVEPLREARPSIQFATCLLALYLHVAIAFGHVSLAFPSASLFVPLIAFPTFSSSAPAPEGCASAPSPPNAAASVRGAVGCLARWTVVAVTSPPAVVTRVLGGTCTPYVQFLYLPLHVLVALLWL